MSTQITLGPVLSFRGIDSKNVWRVTALIGIPDDTQAPLMTIEGRQCPDPVVILTSNNQKFLRYDLSCKLLKEERIVSYELPGSALHWNFTIPGKGYAPRVAYVSCNGFSNEDGMRKLVKPANAVWGDLLCNHDRNLRPETGYDLDKEQLWHETRTHDKGLQRFHLLMMGGDQIYFDSIWQMDELKVWIGLARTEQLDFKVSEELESKIAAYYFSLYSERWLPKDRLPWGSAGHTLDAADAMSRMPTIMMWDDHDIFDGWGSYSVAMQNCDLFKALFHHARRAFWVFQMQHNIVDIPGLASPQRKNISLKDPQFQPLQWNIHQQKDPLALPLLDMQPGFSFIHYVGPLAIVAADLRTERSRTQVMGSDTWSALQAALSAIKKGKALQPGTKIQHLLFLSSVPVVHPKLSLAEGLLDTFGQDHVLDSNADDLKDHWSHDDHEGERKRLLETLIKVASEKMLRVSIVSGDVHVAAWGSASRRDIALTSNWAQIQQFTSSGVVHPSLVGVMERLFLYLLNSTASKPQILDPQYSVEMMLFPGFNRYVMPARNWMAFELDLGKGNSNGSKLWATWRCETETGFSNHLQAVDPAHE